MQDKWINEVFDEKMMMISNPIMHAITGNTDYCDTEETLEMNLTELRTLHSSTQNVIDCINKNKKIEPWMQKKINNASYAMTELNNYLSNSER